MGERVNLRSEVSNNVDDEENSSLSRLHSQVTSTSVSFDRMICGSLYQKVEDGLGRAENIAGCVGDEGEDDDNYQEDECMHLNCIRRFPENWKILLTQSVRKVALIPPNIVYIATPNGNKKQAAAVGIPVKEFTTAEPPVNSMAVTRMFVIKPKTVNVM